MTPQELAASFAAENAEAAALIRAEGAEAERARIQAVREQSMPGHEKLIDALAFDGKTTGPEAAVQVLAAERARIASFASNRAKDAPAPMPQAEAPADAPAVKLGDKPGFIDATVDQSALHAAAKQYQINHPGTSFVDAIKAVQQGA